MSVAIAIGRYREDLDAVKATLGVAASAPGHARA